MIRIRDLTNTDYMLFEMIKTSEEVYSKIRYLIYLRTYYVNDSIDNDGFMDRMKILQEQIRDEFQGF